jgi:hypothetical protein
LHNCCCQTFGYVQNDHLTAQQTIGSFPPLSPGSGAIALAHLDGNGTDEAVSAMVSRVQELALGYPEGRIELQLIGGFRDQQGYAEDLYSNIMRK